MIASVHGTVSAVAADGAVVDVGGVGLFVSCTPATIARLRTGERAQLATSLVVREDSLTLYGFADDDERTVFELLQTASGVGPRLAQAILAVHGPVAIRRAIATDDISALTLVPGIGRKGAQRIVLELKDRLGSLPEVDINLTSATTTSAWRAQVRDALTALGYTQHEADQALAQLAEPDDSPDISTLLRAALQVLS